jgi:hypothetical protein
MPMVDTILLVTEIAAVVAAILFLVVARLRRPPRRILVLTISTVPLCAAVFFTVQLIRDPKLETAMFMLLVVVGVAWFIYRALKYRHLLS